LRIAGFLIPVIRLTSATSGGACPFGETDVTGRGSH
jgi:hypothetical protein